MLYYVILCYIMLYSNDRSKQAICHRQLDFGMTRIKHQFRGGEGRGGEGRRGGGVEGTGGAGRGGEGRGGDGRTVMW